MAHIPYDRLEERVKTAQEKVNVGGVYFHWKNPEIHYRVKALGFLEWDEEMLVVIYQPLNHPTMEWVRPLEGKDGWLTPVKESVYNKQRFVPVSE